MGADTIARALGGRRIGGGWMARCPAHDDRTPSLSIRNSDDGRVLVRCHAGCDQVRVIAALRSRGLWPSGGRSIGPTVTERHRSDGGQQGRDDSDRTRSALRIWRAAVSASGTLVETYLRSRGLVLPLPPAIRFHPALKHPGGSRWPAMVALVTRGPRSEPTAVHRTFIARDGSGKAPIEPAKLSLGPCRGGVVRLADPGDVLMVGEGIETCVAAMQATGYPAWACLSTSGLRNVVLPAEFTEVIILADGDNPGEVAAQQCALRLKREGRRVRIARPPAGLDFNDLLKRQTRGIGEAV